VGSGFPDAIGMATTSASMTLRAITKIRRTLSPFFTYVEPCWSLFQSSDLFPPDTTFPFAASPIKALKHCTPSSRRVCPFRSARMCPRASSKARGNKSWMNSRGVCGIFEKLFVMQERTSEKSSTRQLGEQKAKSEPRSLYRKRSFSELFCKCPETLEFKH
jgi:hypothetical protein